MGWLLFLIAVAFLGLGTALWGFALILWVGAILVTIGSALSTISYFKDGKWIEAFVWLGITIVLVWFVFKFCI